jgi:hypothetical protein
MTTPDRPDSKADLEARAKEYVEDLPAETALGNPDPEGGSDADPKKFDESGTKGSEA